MQTYSVVLDVTNYDEWVTAFGDCARIPFAARSTILHADQSTAEREAVRLALAHPGNRYAVFTLHGIVQTKEVPTHISLGGKVIATSNRPSWEKSEL